MGQTIASESDSKASDDMAIYARTSFSPVQGQNNIGSSSGAKHAWFLKPNRHTLHLVRSVRRFLLLLLAPLLLVITGILFFPSAGRDDAHIGYWVALGLSRFGRVINYNGEAIEQSSTILHALLLAAAHRILRGSVEMVVLGRLSSILFGVATVVVAQRLAAQSDRRLAPATGLLTATSAYFVYWSFGGMEATLCALLALALIFAFGNYLDATDSKLLRVSLIWIALVALAFILARPEHPLILVCLLAGAAGTILIRNCLGLDPESGFSLRRLFVLVGISCLLVIGVLVWRWQTFGSLFPQPVSAKAGSFSTHTLKAGLRYYRKCLILEPGVAIFAITAVAGSWVAARKIFHGGRLQPRLLFCVLFFCAESAFVLLAGGDWMEAGRFLVPLLPVAAFFAVLAIWNLFQKRVGAALTLGILIAAAQIGTILHIAARRSTGVPGWVTMITEPYANEARSTDFTWFERANRVNLRDIPTIRRLERVVADLRAAKGETEPVRIMSAQLGMVAYHVVENNFGHVDILDRRGLIDRRFTACPLLSGLRRSAGGLQLDYSFYFTHRRQLELECRIPRADVIFDIGEIPSMPDYSVIYNQTGKIETNSRWFPGLEVRANQFIAIRNDLLPAIRKDVTQ